MKNTEIGYSFSSPAAVRSNKRHHTVKRAPIPAHEPNNNWVLIVLWMLLLAGLALIGSLTYFILTG